MLKQEIVYIPTKDLTEFEQPLVDGLTDFITKTEAYVFTESELRELLEDTFDSGRKLSNKSQLYTPDFYYNKQDYINNLFK